MTFTKNNITVKYLKKRECKLQQDSFPELDSSRTKGGKDDIQEQKHEEM